MKCPTPPAVLLLAVFLAGCGASRPVVRSPNLAEQVRAADTTTLVVDVTVPEDVEGPMDLIDLPKHRSMGRALTDSATAWLRRKGFAPDALPPSVGYWLPPPDTFRVVRTPSERSRSPEVLSMGRAPFVADSATAYGIDWGAVRRARVPGRRRPDEAPVAPTPGHVVILAKVAGRSVGAEQQGGQSVLSALLSFRRAHGDEPSFAGARLRIVDVTHERVLWVDLEAEEGVGHVGIEDLLRPLRRVVAKLPALPPGE